MTERMGYRTLGRSGLIVSDLCLGTMIFGEDGPRGTPEGEARAMVGRFLDAGGNFVDTADVYAGGRSEEIVGRAIRDVRDDVVLASKARFPTGGGPNRQGLSRRHLIDGVGSSLRRLGTDRLDVLYLHCWDPVTPLEETVRALDDLVSMGMVRYVGVSNFRGWQAMKALALADARGAARFVAAQYQYSLVERGIEAEIAGLCRAEGMGLVPWGPLGGGFLSGKYRRGERPTDASQGRIATAGDEVEEAWERRATERNWRILDAVEAVADARGATVAQVALAWLRDRPSVSSVILGARTEAQLDENLGAAGLVLEAGERERLDAASAEPLGYPYRMIEAYGARDVEPFGG